ncbi:hypothetical protein AB0I77_15860 [Streptomyces sp. NPDC050619]|uniref:hypothetical protein n=1 Tax=Streptomyces sp. NPDC050619 TaxID=3157214 RepID=UPI00342CEB6E
MSDHTIKDRQIPTHAEAVGPGWVPLLARLHTDLPELVPDYQVEDISAELLRLRLVLADRFDPEASSTENSLTPRVRSLTLRHRIPHSEPVRYAVPQAIRDCGTMI